MDFKIVQSINEKTKIAVKDNAKFVLKEIDFADTEMYRRLSTVENKYVVKFFGTTIVDDKFYAVEEFVDGITLSTYLAKKGPLSDNEAILIALEVCLGLKAVHSLGIVHRDINPNNIMLTSNNDVKIIDFGISRTTKANQSCDTQILGTQGYTAPEQFGFHQTNERADIYSVGVLINYMKTMSLPSENLVSGGLSEIVLKCTQIDESNRYRNIEVLMSALHKKKRIRNFIKTIPGFRRGIWWHMIIAIPYYLFFAFCMLLAIPIEKDYVNGIFNFFIFLFGLGVPVPILTNYNNWLEKLSFTKNKSKGKRITFQIFLAIFSVVFALALIIIQVRL